MLQNEVSYILSTKPFAKAFRKFEKEHGPNGYWNWCNYLRHTKGRGLRRLLKQHCNKVQYEFIVGKP